MAGTITGVGHREAVRPAPRGIGEHGVQGSPRPIAGRPVRRGPIRGERYKATQSAVGTGSAAICRLRWHVGSLTGGLVAQVRGSKIG
ncbi:Uncharacterised protein [Mycobacterium tuberculosis]|uniref:Uncharacterized protein n=1 Tax=Mycobacterium tuberculosis TaxID=1773 RepID=A0A654TAI9_MYCTX|nr:Uncharacterised protein [Mycobacterium tuberculosis]